MIYFDAAYVAKCYLNEPGADRGLLCTKDVRAAFGRIGTRQRHERVTVGDPSAIAAGEGEAALSQVGHASRHGAERGVCVLRGQAVWRVDEIGTNGHALDPMSWTSQ